MLTDHMKNACFLGLLGGSVVVAGALAHQTALRDTAAQSLTTGSYQRQYEGHFDANLPTRNWAIDAFAALRLSLLNEVAEGAVLGKGNWLFTAEEMIPPQSAEPLLPALITAQATLADHGVTLLPVILPDKARLHADHLPMQRSATLEGRYDHALAQLTEAGMSALDLRSAMAQAGFMRTDTHWHPEAARAVAARVATDLGQGDTPFVTSRTAAEVFKGDLTAFADAGRFQHWFDVAHEKLPRYRTDLASASAAAAPQMAMDLFGDVDIPVVLLGTSYSAKEEFHFEGFLKSALQMDVLNLAQVGQGPFQPMRDFLTSDHLRDQPPQVVIWEIPERYIAPVSTQDDLSVFSAVRSARIPEGV
jgi:alginate O-acetyltransferase complex protein AlgJ